MKRNPVLRNKQTTLKKFVLPILLILVTSSSVLPTNSDKEDFSRYIMRISLTKTYSEAVSMKNGGKSADWFIRKSKKGKPRVIEKLISNTLLEKATIIVERLFSHGIKLAIDITKIPVYTESKSKFITHSNAEKGTTTFYQFLGFSIAERQLKFPISFHLMEKEDQSNLHKIIKESLYQIVQKIKINLIIMDRGFISSKIVQVIQDLHCSFIIAFRKSQKLSKLFNALENPKVNERDEFFIQGLNQTVHRINSKCWVIHNYSYGKPKVYVNLVIWKAKTSKSKKKKKSKLKHEYFLYITSPDVKPEDVYSLYGTRWRIETAFRQIKDQQAKTRVIDPCHRIWIFGVACIIYASWIYRHLPEDADAVIPEELLTDEIKKAYRTWMYKRIPVRVLVDQYLQVLDLNQPLFS